VLASFRWPIVWVILIVLTLASVADLCAQTDDAPGEGRIRRSMIDLNSGVSFEISPHTGLMGSSGTFGIRLSMNYSSLNLELAGEQVIGRTADLYPISVNVVLNLATRGRLIPYGAVGAGLWLTVPTNTIGDNTVTTLGLNFGGGARYYISRSFGVRIEAKQYLTSVSSDRELKDELLFFQEVSVGVTFMFQ
jgi:hypothetical protein